MNHYEVLGVSRHAEPTVISAAYKALVRIYHPDIYTGDKEYALRRTKELNEAWSVLSSPDLKSQYDRDQFSKGHDKTDFNTSPENDFSNSKSHDYEAFSEAVNDEWEYAASIYEELSAFHRKLVRIDPQLGFLFKACLVEGKNYKHRLKIFKELREDYLRDKFGSDDALRGLALAAIEEGYRDFARELNVALTRLGTSDIDPILEKLGQKYPKFAASAYGEFGYDKLKPGDVGSATTNNAYAPQSKKGKTWNWADWIGVLGMLLPLIFLIFSMLS